MTDTRTPEQRAWQAANDAELARQTAKREFGTCTITGCETPHEGRTLYHCREHGGVMVPQVPGARMHRQRQAPYNRYWR